jgi:hypothetical protein
MDIVILVEFLCMLLGGGVATLWSGRIAATRKSVVEGAPARIIGLLLLLSVPLSIVAAVWGQQLLNAVGVPPKLDSPWPIILVVAPLLGLPLLAVGLGIATAKKKLLALREIDPEDV